MSWEELVKCHQYLTGNITKFTCSILDKTEKLISDSNPQPSTSQARTFTDPELTAQQISLFLYVLPVHRPLFTTEH